MAELVDALVSGTSVHADVEVRVLFRAFDYFTNSLIFRELFFCPTMLVTKSVTKISLYS
jgi:hypothetical protein